MAERTEAAQEHAELRSRLFGGFFHRSRLAALHDIVTEADDVIAGEGALQAVREEQIDRLFELVGDAPILRDGVLTNLDLEEDDE
ncbi:hypothetical protein AB0K60_36370 [Thermopolyspora sp. NPDC052614]|uniref:hypothetical protein n=1 Tax=Thermopolyspora sp. NPDC052614 TaxID=3155682 RepID=UPI0034232409